MTYFAQAVIDHTSQQIRNDFSSSPRGRGWVCAINIKVFCFAFFIIILITSVSCSSGTTPTTRGGATNTVGRSGPYYSPATPGDHPVTIMSATGIKEFTLAFLNSNGGCSTGWDGSRPLTAGSDEALINSIRAAGGDVVGSFGGAVNNPLEEACTKAEELAAAYQAPITADTLHAIDIDTESPSFYSDSAFRHKIVDALKIVQTANPSLNIYVTFGGQPYSLEAGKDMVQYAASVGLNVKAWTSMPFYFGDSAGTVNMVRATQESTETLKAIVASAYGYDDATAYNHVGISSMNGITGSGSESVTLADWQAIIDYAKNHNLGRLSFWQANRDAPCSGEGGGGGSYPCSGITQTPYEFTKALAQFGRETAVALAGAKP